MQTFLLTMQKVPACTNPVSSRGCNPWACVLTCCRHTLSSSVRLFSATGVQATAPTSEAVHERRHAQPSVPSCSLWPWSWPDHGRDLQGERARITQCTHLPLHLGTLITAIMCALCEMQVSGLMLSRMDSLEKYVADDEEQSQYLRRSVEVRPMAGHSACHQKFESSIRSERRVSNTHLHPQCPAASGLAPTMPRCL